MAAQNSDGLLNVANVLAVLALIATQQVCPVVTHNEQTALIKIEKKLDTIMAPSETSAVFKMLRECRATPNADFEDCIANAYKVSFIAHWFKILEAPCDKIGILIRHNKPLLDNKDKHPDRLSQKIANLLQDQETCARLSGSFDSLPVALDTVFREHKKHSNI